MIPFYNESTTIKKVIEDTLRYVDIVIAVNDGSIDDSVSKIDVNENVIVLNETENKGKGFALRKGFAKAVELGCDAVITLDADLQHNPKSIPTLLSGLDNFDLVAGQPT